MKVENMTSNRSGRAVANQFTIWTDNDGVFFQSYRTVIARVYKGETTLDNNWNSSRTTGKYRNQFLGEDKPTTERKIKSGEYKIVDLNLNK
jgi:hypothetical protein